MLLRSVSFGGGYATVVDKLIEWETGRTGGEYYEWWKIQVIDNDGDVYWFELDEYDVYFDFVKEDESIQIVSSVIDK
jgi:hypothetical protein